MTGPRAGVVGGGIIGVAVARELALKHGARVTLYEKEAELAAHQSGHNSGVVHAGLYYEPGSLKARLCRRGGTMMSAFVRERGIPFDECGKVVVATSEREVPMLEAIFGKALANGVPDARMIGRSELFDLEPGVRAVAAIHSPHSAITDYAAVTRSLADDVEAAGGGIELASEVTDIRARGEEVIISTGGAREGTSFDLVITCAGLQSDRVAQLSDDRAATRIVPFSGAYFLLRQEKRSLVNGLIYPVPDPRYPFLGIHLTKRIDGEVMVGPNAFVAGAREGYRRGSLSARDLADVGTFGGFWRFAAANLPAAARELRVSLSTNAFISEAQKYVPALTVADIRPGFRGIRAQAMLADGSLADDFLISGRGRVVNLRNAPSPGATASLAIAEYVVTRAMERL